MIQRLKQLFFPEPDEYDIRNGIPGEYIRYSFWEWVERIVKAIFNR
jgi:hypothetical protein